MTQSLNIASAEQVTVSVLTHKKLFDEAALASEQLLVVHTGSSEDAEIYAVHRAAQMRSEGATSVEIRTVLAAQLRAAGVAERELAKILRRAVIYSYVDEFLSQE